jgi:protein-tyrosine phosphatase
MDRLRELKNRPQRPFSVHIGNPEESGRYVSKMPPLARRLISKAWPGPLTLLVRAGGRLAEKRFQEAGLYDVLCFEDIIGLRCPSCPSTQQMLSAVDWPVVAPSANPAGMPSPRNAGEVLSGLDGKIDLLIDSGPTRFGQDSTIVRVDGGSWRLVREGVLNERKVERLMRKVILFVCTGNTCRSPIAEGLAAKMLAEAMVCPEQKLSSHGFEVLSAGLWSFDGGRASPEAVEAAKALGANIAGHRTRKLTTDLITEADVVFCMTAAHVAEVCRIAPSASGKVRRLWAVGDISDPVGGGDNVYSQTAGIIQQALRIAIREELHEDSASR